MIMTKPVKVAISATFDALANGATSTAQIQMPNYCTQLVGVRVNSSQDFRFGVKSRNVNIDVLQNAGSRDNGNGEWTLAFDTTPNDLFVVSINNNSGGAVTTSITLLFG